MNDIVKIEKLDHSGRGIGKLNDKIIFVDQALIDEEIRIKITLDKKKYCEGQLIEIIKKNKDRIESKCPYFNECGGCDLLHMPYSKQLEFKQNKVIDIISKYSNISNVQNIVKDIIASDQVYNYRNKVTFQIKETIGFYKKKSYDLIAIEKCLLITDKMNVLLKEIKENIDLKNVSQVVIKDMGNCQTMLTFYLHNNSNIEEIINKFSNKVTSLNIFINNNLVKTISKSKIIVNVSDEHFLVSPTAFFQVNLGQTVKLYDKVLEYCDLKNTDNVLDLYCGTGTIGIYLSKYCHQVLGIEINKEAIRDANENKDINKINNINFIVGDTKDVLKKVSFLPDIIVVDPPRSGLDTKVVETIIKMHPKKMIYVSCDPMTLARDLKVLNEYYKVDEVTPLDMFPNTYHVECVCLLKTR